MPTLSVDYLTPAEAARELNVSDDTIRRWRREGVGPTYIKVGGRYRYPILGIQRYLEERTVATR